MKKQLSILYKIFLLAHLAMGQDVNSYNGEFLNDLENLNAFTPVALGLFTKKFDQYGSPYLLNDFNKGEITLVSRGATISNIDLRYDVLNEKLEVKQFNKNFIADQSLIKMFTIYTEKKGEMIFVNASFLREDETTGFAQKIYESGNLLLLKKYVKEKLIYDSSVPYTSNSNYIKYKEEEKYYLVDSLDIHPISTKKKLIYKFPELSSYQDFKSRDLKDEVVLKDMCDFLSGN